MNPDSADSVSEDSGIPTLLPFRPFSESDAPTASALTQQLDELEAAYSLEIQKHRAIIAAIRSRQLNQLPPDILPTDFQRGRRTA